MKNDVESSSQAQYALLRAHVEREVRRAGVVMVTSAEAGDGKSLTAYSLALSLAQSGRRTALVNATGDPAAMPAIPDAPDQPTLVSIPRSLGSSLRETLAEFVGAQRASFDYTIVDSAPLLTDNLAMLLADCVDGVLVSIRLGRKPTDNDEAAMQVMDQCNGRVVGVVAVTPEAIDDFTDRCRSTIVADRSERRLAVDMRAIQSAGRALTVIAVVACSAAFLAHVAIAG